MIKSIIVKDSSDFNGYTHMHQVFSYFIDIVERYNWLITDIECSYNTDIFKYSNSSWGNYLIDGKLLNEHLIKNQTQFIWGAFSAIPIQCTKSLNELINIYFPTVNDNSELYSLPIKIQHPLAEIEVDCCDSSYFIIKALDSIDLNGFSCVNNVKNFLDYLS